MEQGVGLYGMGDHQGARVHRIRTKAIRARSIFTIGSLGACIEIDKKQIEGQDETLEALGLS
jgi:hypothetical protein